MTMQFKKDSVGTDNCILKCVLKRIWNYCLFFFYLNHLKLTDKCTVDAFYLPTLVKYNKNHKYELIESNSIINAK